MASNELKAILSEYEKLRDEIQHRSNNQLFCVTVSIASVGVLIGFLVEDVTTRLPILLVIPWILSVFGIIWLDHNSRIFELGNYIKEEIEKKKLTELFKKSDIKWIWWENYITEKRKEFYRKAMPISRIVSRLSLIYFFMPSILSVFAYFILRFTPNYISQLDIFYILLEVFLIGFPLVFILLFIKVYYDSRNIMKKSLS